MKKGASFFLSLFVSVVVITSTIAPAFAQLGNVTPPVVPPPAPVVTPPPPVEVTPEPVTQPTSPIVAPVIAPADTTPPIISGVLEASLLPTEATIVWATDELAVSTLEYGTSQSYGSQATLGVSALLAHTATLLGLTPGMTYYYCIHATDLTGNIANSCNHSFATAAAASSPSVSSATSSLTLDTNLPNVSLVTIAPVATSSAAVNWTTDEVANGEVEYGLTASYGHTSNLDTAFSLNHSITLTGLTPNTEYHYRIKSSDEIGNQAVTSDNNFSTESLVSVSSQISSPETTSTVGSGTNSASVSGVVISGIEPASIGTSTVTIAWMTDLPSDSQIEYGDSSLLGHVTTLSTTLTTSHSVTLTGLSPNTNYYFKVKSKPVGVSVATVSSLHDFNTLSHATPSIPPANIVSTSAGTAGTSTIAISVAADKAVTAQVEYGITTEYGQTSTLDINAQTSHTLPLTSLVPNTTYQYRVKVVDTADNITYSENATFTTAALVSSNGAPVVQAVPDAITTLSVSSHDAYSATLTWNVGSVNADVTDYYDIRYSTFPITEGNFASALQDQATLVPYVDLEPSGTSRTYLVAGLNHATTYYFALKSKFQNSGYSMLSNSASVTLSSVSVAASESQAGSASGGSSGGTTQTGGGSGGGGGGGYYPGTAHSTGSGQVNAPILLNATPADSEVVFTWKNPNEPSFVRTVIVVKKTGGYPTSPQDGQTIYEGNGETFTDTSVTNGTTYYYAMYSYDHAKHYSPGVKISLAPQKGLKQVVFNKTPMIVSATPAEHFVETLKRGKQDIEVEHLQEVLAADEGLYPEKLITGYFGSLTENALKRFQQKHNLPQTGITDTATQAKLNIVSRSLTKLSVPEDIVLFENDLKYGDQGNEVWALQEYLIYEGSYKEALVTGYFGNYTKNAVSIFQKKYGVQPVSGFFGPKTRHRLREITGL